MASASSAATADSSSRKWPRARIYGLRSFMDPGCPTDFAGAFADNIRRFVSECADAEPATDPPAARIAPTWCTQLVDEKSGVAVPMYAVEECVRRTEHPFCDYCRCNDLVEGQGIELQPHENDLGNKDGQLDGQLQ